MTQSQLFPNIGGILLETKEQNRLNQTEIPCDSKKKKKNSTKSQYFRGSG